MSSYYNNYVDYFKQLEVNKITSNILEAQFTYLSFSYISKIVDSTFQFCIIQFNYYLYLISSVQRKLVQCTVFHFKALLLHCLFLKYTNQMFNC